jgi:hypothetical protein
VGMELSISRDVSSGWTIKRQLIDQGSVPELVFASEAKWRIHVGGRSKLESSRGFSWRIRGLELYARSKGDSHEITFFCLDNARGNTSASAIQL